MFDIFDDMDDFALDFDMASESYLDSVDEEINDWEDAANEAVGYDAIKDKVDAALEEFKENIKFAGKVVWGAIKKAAAAVKAFFKALPGRIAKFIRQSIEKIKMKIHDIGKGKESANDKAKRLATKIETDAKTCKTAGDKLVKVINAEVSTSKKDIYKIETEVGTGKQTFTDYRTSENSYDGKDRKAAQHGDVDAYLGLNEAYNKANKAFDKSFSEVLKSAIGFTKALAKGNSSIQGLAKTVTTSLNFVVGTFITFIDTLEKGVTVAEKIASANKDKGWAAKGTANKILNQYRSAVSSFSNKKDRIEEQIKYIENALTINKDNKSK